MVAPSGLRERFLQLVDREIENAKAGRASGIILLMNSLVDRACVDALYRASSAGVEIDLIVRGACTVVPGVEGLSDRIRVRSIVGEFLEHSRIWRFENGRDPEWLIGSADLMDRNLDRRIEAFSPIDDPEARRVLDEILTTMLADDRRAWSLASDGRWHRVEQLAGRPGDLDAQQWFKELARLRSADAATPRRPHAGLGSLEPWA